MCSLGRMESLEQPVNRCQRRPATISTFRLARRRDASPTQGEGYVLILRTSVRCQPVLIHVTEQWNPTKPGKPLSANSNCK